MYYQIVCIIKLIVLSCPIAISKDFFKNEAA